MLFRQTLLAAALVCAAFVLSVSHATAAELSYCDGECVCGAEDGYDICTIFSGTINVDDPHEVREALNVTADVISESEGTYAVRVRVADPRTMVLPMNQYSGDWPSLEELNDFTNELIWGPNGPPDPDPAAGFVVDYCDLGTLWDVYEQSGKIARYDQNATEWADDQVQNIIVAAAGGPDGVIRVEGVPMLGFDTASQQRLRAADGPVVSAEHDKPYYDGVCSLGYAARSDYQLHPATEAGNVTITCEQ